MKPSTRRQIRNGLRIAGGMGLFLIAAMILGVAIDGLQAGAGHLRLWPNGAIALGLIVLVTAILVLSARVWILYIAGCLLFALPKCFIVIASGRDFYSPHAPFSRLVAAELGLFSLVSLFLIYRVTQNHAPGIVDRMAFTFFTLALVFAFSRQEFAVIAIWQVAGVVALCLAWLLSRRKHGRQGVLPH